MEIIVRILSSWHDGTDESGSGVERGTRDSLRGIGEDEGREEEEEVKEVEENRDLTLVSGMLRSSAGGSGGLSSNLPSTRSGGAVKFF